MGGGWPLILAADMGSETVGPLRTETGKFCIQQSHTSKGLCNVSVRQKTVQKGRRHTHTQVTFEFIYTFVSRYMIQGDLDFFMLDLQNVYNWWFV